MSINVNTMSLVWYLPLIMFEVHRGGLIDSPALSNVKYHPVPLQPPTPHSTCLLVHSTPLHPMLRGKCVRAERVGMKP